MRMKQDVRPDFSHWQMCLNTHRQVKLDGIYRSLEGPWELVLPQRLEHHLEQILQLVGLPLRPCHIDDLWGRGVSGVRGLRLGLPLTAAAPWHRCGIQTVTHTGWMERGHQGGWRWMRGWRLRRRGHGTPLVQPRARRGLCRESAADSIALLTGISVRRRDGSLIKNSYLQHPVTLIMYLFSQAKWN